MEIQTKPVFKARTPKIKCITSHPSFPDVLVCLFNGEIRLYDPKTFSVKKTAQICNCPIRTAVIVPSKDCILVGNDEGFILVVDLGNLTVLETVKAHNDFIRRLVVDENNKRVISVSDDNRTKLWSFADGIVLVSKYKDAKHFVMDACLYPSDNNKFFTVSLDAKVRMYSVTSTNLLKVFKGHEKGINSIAFLNSETFVTGADDCNVMVWDVRRPSPVAVLKGHTKNVNVVKPLKSGFASCSEDNTVRIWNSEYKTTEVLPLQGRAWDVYYKDGKVFVGSDEELSVFQELSSVSIGILREGKIFYNIGNTIFSVKSDELGAYKELGELGDTFESFTVNSNGKLVAIMGNEEISVNSTLGMRKKYTDQGRDLCFIDAEKFVYLKNGEMIFVTKNEVTSKVAVEDINRVLYANETKVILNARKTAIYTIGKPGSSIQELGITASKATMVGDYTVLFGEQIQIFNKNLEETAVLDYAVVSFILHDNIVMFSTVNKTFYLIMHEEQAHVSQMRYYGNLIGVKDNTLFYFSNGIKTDVIDIDFINFKRDFFSGLEPEPLDTFRDKAISFFETLGLHEKALGLCSDENQKFEILIKLNRLEDALQSANSPIKFGKLGRKFLSNGEFSKASECFMKADDLDSLFLTDTFGDKKYFEYVAERAKEIGRNNLAFLAAYKNKNYKMCAALLKDTPFYRAFVEHHLEIN